MYYILLIIALGITLGSQAYIKSTYSKYSKVKNTSKLTGQEAARKILDNNGLTNVAVVEVPGTLTDHYDPRKKQVALSTSNYNECTISAISVAAHECGHAIQDKENYTFMRIRSSLVPIVNLTSYAGYFAMILGAILGALNVLYIGIIAEVAILVFQIVTLPVEFDASRRALKEAEKHTILNKNELKQGKTVLTSAALTYVASVATAIIELLRLLIIYGNRRED